jgi:hypothetical protein
VSLSHALDRIRNLMTIKLAAKRPDDLLRGSVNRRVAYVSRRNGKAIESL